MLKTYTIQNKQIKIQLLDISKITYSWQLHGTSRHLSPTTGVPSSHFDHSMWDSWWAKQDSSKDMETSEHTSRDLPSNKMTPATNLQEYETVLHLVNDCPHHRDERHPLSVAAAIAGIDWPPGPDFWVQCTTFPLLLMFAKRVQGKKAQAPLRHARNLTHSDFTSGKNCKYLYIVVNSACVPMPTHCTITCFRFHSRWIDGVKCGLFSNHAPLGQTTLHVG